MRVPAAERARRPPHRSRLSVRAGNLRRGELAAGLATAAVLTQLLLAQLPLAIAAGLIAVGRVSRWRPHWIALPALAGLGWLLTVGVAAPTADFAAGSTRFLGYLAALAAHPARLPHLAAYLATAGRWLSGELPLALLAGTAEAALVLWLHCWRGRNWRAGLIAAVRCRIHAKELAAGHTVTRHGCALGLNPGTGGLAGLSWAEAECGVLLAGPDSTELGRVGLAVACAAIRRRKTVLVLDLAGSLEPAGQLLALARSAGVSLTEIGAPFSGLSASLGRAIRSRGVLVVSVRPAEAAHQVLDELASVLTSLRDLQLRADCLSWVYGCERLEPSLLARLLALGPATGTAILLGTSSAAQAASLSDDVGAVVVAGQMAQDRALLLSGLALEGHQFPSAALSRAADGNSSPLAEVPASATHPVKQAFTTILATQRPGTFTLITTAGGVLPDCRAIRFAAAAAGAAAAVSRSPRPWAGRQ